MASDNSVADRVKLVKVKKNEAHARALYELLKRRTHNISHVTMPPLEEHLQFVKHHPYRAWYLIEHQGDFVGSVYLLKSNNIGISVLPDFEACMAPALVSIMQKYQPLPAIKSVRTAEFSLNVALNNDVLKRVLESMGGFPVQETYVFRNGIKNH